VIGNEIVTVVLVMTASVHDRIRDWLIALGQENGYEAWTTDRKDNVEFSKFRDAKVDYRPDVVWKKQNTREKVFFELAFADDFRKVVEETFLASQVENFSKMYFIRPTTRELYWKEIEKFLNYTFRRSEGVVKTRHRPSFIIFPRSLEEDRKEDEIKERIVETLKKDNWLVRESEK
jgi:hypothetical protein